MTKKIKNLEIMTFTEFKEKHLHNLQCPNYNCMFEQYLKTFPKELDVSDWDKLEIPSWILANYFSVFSYNH